MQCFLLPLPCLPPQGFAVFLPLSWDHPRIRGEHSFHNVEVFTNTGSSPHPRGTPPPHPAPRREYRIIPASAGNTPKDRNKSNFEKDHPRIRGEHSSFPPYEWSPWGSSPHPRGTRPDKSRRVVLRGIIPASAGNTGSTMWKYSLTRDHPRIRGEHPD